MTLISSWGGPDSNSYIDVTQANSFIESAIYDNSAWTSITSADKVRALVQATQDVDARQYIGHRFFYDQHLEFPRQMRSAFPFNRTSAETISQDVNQKRMQTNVQQATAWQALFIVQNGGQNPHLKNIASGIKGISESVGPIREFVQYGKSTQGSGGSFDSNALKLLQDWMTGRRIYRK